MEPSESRYLLIISCSKRKKRASGLLPAMERYDGISYLILKKAKRKGYLPKNLDLLIISAKYGLIEADSLIEDYDLLMTEKRAKQLKNLVAPMLAEKVKLIKYNEIFLNIGKTYKMALEGWDSDIRRDSSIIFASGSIGKKSSQMLRWLIEKQ